MEDRVRTETLNSLARMEALLPPRGRVLILPHNYPDPDALASAAAMELLLAKRFGLRGQIVFSGEVSRAENKELLRHFKYRWKLLEQFREPAKRLPCVLVDTVPWSRNVTVPNFARPIVVVDHHPRRKRSAHKGMFVDIRSGRGATASIMAEYLAAANVVPPRWLASILAYAIATETLDLSRNSAARDLDAYIGLLARANFALMGRIRHAPLPRVYYQHLQEAMRNGRTYRRVAWTHLDSVPHPEIVAEVADLLLRLERITWAFCTAFSNNRLIVSLRSSQQGARCGQILKRIMRHGGSGGGHHSMAAGYLKLTSEDAEAHERKKDDLVRGLVERIEPRLLQAQKPLNLVAQALIDS